MKRFYVIVYSGEKFATRCEVDTMTQARKACKQYMASGYTSAGIIDNDKSRTEYVAKFGDISVLV